MDIYFGGHRSAHCKHRTRKLYNHVHFPCGRSKFSGPKVWCKEMYLPLFFYNFTLSVLNSPFLWTVDSKFHSEQGLCPWYVVRPCEHWLRCPQSPVVFGQQSAQATIIQFPTILSFSLLFRPVTRLAASVSCRVRRTSFLCLRPLLPSLAWSYRNDQVSFLSKCN